MVDFLNTLLFKKFKGTVVEWLSIHLNNILKFVKITNINLKNMEFRNNVVKKVT